MNAAVVVLVTVLLLALSAFFVAVEFALLASKRHRLEDRAKRSRSARAALRSSGELTILLAGAQLGITACTLALGAITKPAVHHWLTPLIDDWLPFWAADAIGFALALMIVTFLHLVVGEMMPKSWALTHPETSASMLAIPMRAFMACTRPLLVALNSAANSLLRKVGVEPASFVDTGQTPDDLRHLVEHSANVGSIDAQSSTQLASALQLRDLTVQDLLVQHDPPVTVDHDATTADIQALALSTGHLRILLRADAIGSQPTAVVHVRDTLLAAANDPAAAHARPVLTLDADTPLHTTLSYMRDGRQHLAVVQRDGASIGVVTLADIMTRLFPDTAAPTLA